MRCPVPLWDMASKKVMVKCGPLTLFQNHEWKQICFLYNLLVGSCKALLATESGQSPSPFQPLCSLWECGKAHSGSASDPGRSHWTPDLVLSPAWTLSPSPGAGVAQALFEFKICLLQPPMCWDYRCGVYPRLSAINSFSAAYLFLNISTKIKQKTDFMVCAWGVDTTWNPLTYQHPNAIMLQDFELYLTWYHVY